MNVKKKTTIELLNESEKGYVSIEEKELTGIEDITFEI